MEKLVSRRRSNSLLGCTKNQDGYGHGNMVEMNLLLAHVNSLITVLVTMSSISSSFALTTRPGPLFAGFDLGTSGTRISIIEGSDDTESSDDHLFPNEIYSNSITWSSSASYDSAASWLDAIRWLFEATPVHLRQNLKSICFSGTSASCLLVNKHNEVSRKARMYNYDITKSTSPHIEKTISILKRFVPECHIALSTTGSLAKLLLWNEESSMKKEFLAHQSDYVVRNFLSNDHEEFTVTSDWHNCLKLGYDVQNLAWPKWFKECLETNCIPFSVIPHRVLSPGQVIGKISSEKAKKFQINDACVLVAGTTDSNAAFFAAMGNTCFASNYDDIPFGTAVTSLGSTLAIKQLSKQYCEDASRGVYSHRFPIKGNVDNREEAWLTGGASNVGCAVLREEGFTNEELNRLSTLIDPNTDSPLNYYPLVKKGERFPIADAERLPLLEPKPETRAEYLHAILQGISDVEEQGFQALGDLGATPSIPNQVWTCGGGAKNDMWLRMREKRLSKAFGTNIPVKRAVNTEASYGAAILASSSFT